MAQQGDTRHLPWDGSLTQGLASLTVPVVPGPGAGATANPVVAALRRYGFAILDGLAGDGGRDAAAENLLALAGALGTVVPQSPRGELVEDVRDFSDVETRDDRGYRSRGELAPHSDPSTLIVLHCLRPAMRGGESRLVNVRAAHDRVAASSSTLLATLFADYPHWRVAGQYGIATAGPANHDRPVLAERDGEVSCVYYRPFIELSARTQERPLSAPQQAALDLFDRWTMADELALRFDLRPGQTLVIHNRAVLHARTDYQDWPDAVRRRHLLRLWIDAPALLPVSSCHELGDLFDPAAGDGHGYPETAHEQAP